ncbi:NACHT domain-containing protein [Micromonospora sp. NPDC092111]|uniref:NACHT domain-containing protein n=1 Tax=Micromonospora sp. NPDC092111 TaxID=3364289 RepID=UPI00381A796B
MTTVAVGACLALVGNLATGTVQPKASWWPPLVWTLVGLLVGASVLVEVAHRRIETPEPSAPDLGSVADQLAQTVGRQWRQEERHRRVGDPIAIPVRWNAAADDLVDHWANIRRSPAGTATPPLPVAGRLEQIADVYRRIPSGRLIILGRAGAGKTVTAARLLLDLLADRPTGGAVPVIFNVGSWDPTTTTLPDWLAGQLRRDHPGLTAAANGSNLATALLTGDRILPILDGFDEIGPGLRHLSLRQLNTLADLPLIITSRGDEYAAVVRDGDVLTAAAGIELADLSLTDLANYLPRTTRRRAGDNAAGLWDPVLEQLRHQPLAPGATLLRSVLSNPLMVFLARTVYSDAPGSDPGELLDAHRFPTVEAVEAHLLGGYLPAVYQDHATARHGWEPEQVRHWFSHLARHLDRLGTRDLAWWQLGTAVTGNRRGLPHLLPYLLPVLFGATFGATFQVARASAWAGTEFITLGLMAVVVGTALGLAIGASAKRRGALPPGRLRLRIRGNERPLVDSVVICSLTGLWGSFFFGPAAAVSIAVALATFFIFSSDLVHAIDITATPSASESLAVDRRNALIAAGAAGLMVGFATGVSTGAGFGTVFGLGIAATVATATAWGHWLFFVRLRLPLTGRLPWRVHYFLTDAYQRGVLRQAGAVYQFRHARLQDHLAHPGDA